MILCVLKQILHKKKAILIQLLVSPIFPYCYCHTVTKSLNSGIVEELRTPKMHLRPLQWDKMSFGYEGIKIQCKNRSKFSHLLSATAHLPNRLHCSAGTVYVKLIDWKFSFSRVWKFPLICENKIYCRLWGVRAFLEYKVNKIYFENTTLSLLVQ